MGIYNRCERDVKKCRPHSLKPEVFACLRKRERERERESDKDRERKRESQRERERERDLID